MWNISSNKTIINNFFVNLNEPIEAAVFIDYYEQYVFRKKCSDCNK